MRRRWVFSLVLLLSACDPEGRRKCDWVLEVEPAGISKVAPGMVPLCARNRVTMKQDCRIMAPVDFAKKVVNRKCRYADIERKGPGIPRRLVGVRFCDGGEERLQPSKS